MAFVEITRNMPRALVRKMDKMLRADERIDDIVNWLATQGYTVGRSTLYFRRAKLRGHTKAFHNNVRRCVVEASTPREIELLFPRQKRQVLAGFDAYWAAKFEAFKKARAQSQPNFCMCGAANANELGFCPACAATVESVIPQLKEARP